MPIVLCVLLANFIIQIHLVYETPERSVHCTRTESDRADIRLIVHHQQQALPAPVLYPEILSADEPFVWSTQVDQRVGIFLITCVDGVVQSGSQTVPKWVLYTDN